MFSIEQIEKFLFIDVETASCTETFEELSPTLQSEWTRKSERLFGAEKPPAETYLDRAAIYSEFGRVVCISCGYVQFNGAQPSALFKSFYHENERETLAAFADMLARYWDKKDDSRYQKLMCGHNVREFDAPYLCRRMAINRLPPPKPLRLFGQKKWDTALVDTMELWQCGDYKAYTSLLLLTEVLGIASPKSDMNGAQVGPAFWQDRALEKIARYCEQDVRAVIQVVLRLSNLLPLAEDV